jgi:type II secretory pathway pseudopilin PulG
MSERSGKIRLRKAMTLLELVVAMAMITIIFAAVLPQFELIRNSWDAKQGTAEALQNGRVLMDHISRNLSKAKRITVVSDSSVTTGYIQFVANDSNTYRYDINSTDNYVKYGRVGYSAADLAGPSSLKFTCYDACNLDASLSPVTDVNVVRTIKVDATVTNVVSPSHDKTFTTRVYLRVNANTGGVVGCWKLDETSGTTAVDSSGNGNNGALVNMTSPGCWVAGQIGGALVFDGSDDYVDLGTDSSLNFGDSEPFTIAAWIKTTDEYGLIVSFRNSEDDGSDIDFAVGNEGGDGDHPGKAMILVRQDGGGEWASVISGPSVNDGQWHHVAAVRGSGSTIELFVDGVSQGTSSGSESGGAITTNVRAIGCEVYWDCGGDEYCSLAGTIDDVRIYKRALTAEEIAELANVLRYGGFAEAKAPTEL